MRVCLLTDKPDHPLLAAAASLLSGAGDVVTFLDPDAGTGDGAEIRAGIGTGTEVLPGQSAGRAAGDELADVYLLKAHTPRAIALARRLEARGARVVNSADATHLCQDRSRIAQVAMDAGLPMPRTSTLDTLSRISVGVGQAGGGFPFMVKSRHNRRGDLVARVDDAAGLRELVVAWPDEPVVIQEFMENSGWDHKVWVVDGHVFTAVRPAPAEAQPAGARNGQRAGGSTAPVVREPPQSWADLALRVGEVFGLEVYGVDILDRRGAAVVVDINAFPGIRGPQGAPEALAALVSGASRTR